MQELRLRYQQIKDARRFYQILNCSDFEYFTEGPASIEAERGFLRDGRAKRADGSEHNFAILLDEEVVGAVGLHIDLKRRYIGEIGYFVERVHWGRGIASWAVLQAERFGFDELDLQRIELCILKDNAASVRVAEKCGYRREGIQRAKLLHEGEYKDSYLYAKTRRERERER